MKKFLFYAVALALPLVTLCGATDTSGVTIIKGSGTFLTRKATDKAGLHGTASIQNVATDTAYKALVDHGVIAAGAQDYSVQHKTVSLTAANLIAMYATPVVILPAPGAGKSIVIAKAALTMTRTSTAFTGGGVAILQYGTTANGAGQQALDSTIAATVVTGSAGTAVTLRNGAVISDLAAASIQNIGLYISNQTAAFAAGTGTATLDVWYYVY